MADKLSLPVLDIENYRNSDYSLNISSLLNDSLNTFGSLDLSQYDLTPYFDFPGTFPVGDYAKNCMLGSSNACNNFVNFLSLSYPTLFTDNVDYYNNLKTLYNSNSFSNSDFELGIDNIDISVFLIGAGIILLALASIWAIKKALRIFK